MKSYWIVAAAVAVTAWPSSSTAYVAYRAPADGLQSAQPQSSSSSAAPIDSAKLPALQTDAAMAATVTANAPAATANAQAKNSFLLVELSKTLKANKLKPGDKIRAEVSQDVVSHGKVIIPVETELIGHVTEVAVRNDGSGESRLGFMFDRIKLKHFHDVNFRAVVQAVSAPMQRRSRVDEPSQMLPPSMMGAGRTQGPSLPGSSRTSSPAGRAAASPTSPTASSIGSANSYSTYQAPLTVKESPSTHTETGSSAAQLQTASGGPAMSVGMPHGVSGLKGLSLTDGATVDTPGPVVISSTDNVKLESGTQVLLRVMSVETPQEPAKK